MPPAKNPQGSSNFWAWREPSFHPSSFSASAFFLSVRSVRIVSQQGSSPKLNLSMASRPYIISPFFFSWSFASKIPYLAVLMKNFLIFPLVVRVFEYFEVIDFWPITSSWYSLKDLRMFRLRPDISLPLPSILPATAELLKAVENFF